MVGFLWCIIWSVIDAVTSPWRNLIWFVLWLYFTIWRVAFTTASNVLNAPLRILDAVRREQQLKTELCKLQLQCEEFKKRKEDSKTRLEFIAKDRRRLKESLDHALGQWEMSIERLKVLKTRVQELEFQNLQLKGLKQDDQMIKNTIAGGWKSAKLEYRDNQIPNMLVATIHNPCWEDGKRSVKQKYVVEGHDESLHADVSTDRLDDMWYKGRGPAIVSSIFSAILSSIVGVIIYEAQDPCMPLVTASVIVVGMSLKNVIKFFSKLQDRFGSEAVALLSFNCFMLGTLTFPAFPRIASFLSLILMESVRWIVGYFK